MPIQEIGRKQSQKAHVPTRRLTALDGLRGVAAVVVVLHHTFYLNPAWPGTQGGAAVASGSVMWWLSYTPLKVGS